MQKAPKDANEKMQFSLPILARNESDPEILPSTSKAIHRSCITRIEITSKYGS